MSEHFDLTNSFSVNWRAIKTLKVLNDKLLLVMNDGVVIEISGLPARTVDQLFVSYSRYLRQHQRELVKH